MALGGQADAARRRAHAPVPRHLRAADDADSAGESDRRGRQARPDRARHAHPRSRRTSSEERPLRDHRRDRVAPAHAFATAQAAAAAAPQPPPQAPFRAGVDLVSLNVTVTDGPAQYVTDLTADDFNVFEDGVKQDVTFFNRTNLPIALALLLDTSASMESKLPTAQEAAIGFGKRLRAQDLAEVIDFDSRVVVLQNFTNSAAELEAAIRKTSAGGSTSLYNAVYIALKDLKKVVAKNSDEIRRQAIVVLSDGEDTSSLLPFEEVLDLAKRSETAIYSIGLRAPTRDRPIAARASRKPSSCCGSSRRKPAARSFFPNQVADLAGVYGQISDELSSQYTVGYTSRNPKRDGAWRRVVVRVSRPNLTARTKLGYFAPTPSTR